MNAQSIKMHTHVHIHAKNKQINNIMETLEDSSVKHEKRQQVENMVKRVRYLGGATGESSISG